jgi:hypothetical protein
MLDTAGLDRQIHPLRRLATMTQSNPAGRDLGAVFDAHINAEFVAKDVAATCRNPI